MKNKPSDLEKAFRFILPAVVGCLVIFLFATALNQNSGVGRGAFAVIVMGIGFYLFIKPHESKRRPHQSKIKSYINNRLDDLLMKKIYEAYSVKEDLVSEEEENSDDESDENADSEDNFKNESDSSDESDEDTESEEEGDDKLDENADSEDNAKDESDSGDELDEDAENKEESDDKLDEDADSEDEEESDDEANEDADVVQSDLEKAYTFLVPALGGFLILLFFATGIYQIAGAGGTILFIFGAIIIGIGLYVFIDWSLTKYGHPKPKEGDSEEESDDEADEDADSEDDAEDEEESDDEAGENDNNDESGEDDNSENDIEDENDSEDDIEEEEKDLTFQDSKVEKTKIYPVAVIYDGSEENAGNWLKTLISPVQLPITISAAWFVIIIVTYNFFPDTVKSISKLASPSIFTVLPILFLVGLSGFLGILLKQPSESLETTPKERITYILNIFKMIAGWGAVAYIVLTNLLNY